MGCYYICIVRMIQLSNLKSFFSFFFKTKSVVFNIPQHLIEQSQNRIVLNTQLPTHVKTHLPAAIQATIKDIFLNIYWRDFCGFLYVEKVDNKQYSLISDVTVPKWAMQQPKGIPSIGNPCNKQKLVLFDNTTLILYNGVLRLAMNPQMILEIMNQHAAHNVFDYELIGAAVNSKVKEIVKNQPRKGIVTDDQIQELPFALLFAEIVEDRY